MDKYINYKEWGEIIYPFPNFNVCAVEVWEGINNFILDFTGYVTIFQINPC